MGCVVFFFYICKLLINIIGIGQHKENAKQVNKITHCQLINSDFHPQNGKKKKKNKIKLMLTLMHINNKKKIYFLLNTRGNI